MKLAAGIAVVLVSSQLVQGDFVTPTNWTRGDVNSSYGQWEIFTAAAGPNAPDVGQFNPTGRPLNVFDSSGQSFITSGGNIYSFAAPLNVHVIVPSYGLGSGFNTTVIVQVRSAGSEIDPASVKIGSQAPVEVVELFRQPMVPGGFIVDMLYRFQLTGNAPSYEVRFDGAESSLSLDRVAVDSFASAPPPACYANCDGVGGLTGNDFQCFLNQYVSGASYANCDGVGGLTPNDFQCFLNHYVQGCP